MAKHEIILAGSGGQGLIVAGIILGLAAHDSGYNVSQTQSFGIAARGGSSQVEVVIDNQELVYPKVIEPDIIVTLTEDAFKKYSQMCSKDTILIYDSDTVLCAETKDNVYGYKLTSLTMEMNNTRSINICSLGVIMGHREVVPIKALENTIENFFPKKFKEANLAVFRKGIELAKNKSILTKI